MYVQSESRNRRRLEVPMSTRTRLAQVWPGSADLAEGYAISAELSTIGGARYTNRTEVRKDGSKKLVKEIDYDDPELQQLSQNAINTAYYALHKWCVPLFNSLYFCPIDDFATFDEAISESRKVAAAANQAAKELKSQRKTRVEIFPFAIARSNARFALRTGQAIHEYLTRLRETYTADKAGAFNAEMRNVWNLHKLVTGHQRSAIETAIDSARAERPKMILALGGRRGTKELKRGKESTTLDYVPIDRAIALFAPAADAFLGLD